jgi:hypothetical protein
VVRFFSPAHFAHSLHTFDAVEQLRQGCAMRPSLYNRAGRAAA